MSLTDYIVSPDALTDEIHVWFCRPDEITDTQQLAHYKSLLSDEECQQHKRFHFKKDQHSYLVSHALVRNVLSKYADISPDQWQFNANTHGRPEIKQSTSGAPLKFNLTHTPGLCACVVTLGSVCGIDAEIVNRKNNLRKIAERMFAKDELSTLEKLHNSEFRKAFFRFWTLRESYLKALGTGLGGSSKDFHFSIRDDDIAINYDNAGNDLHTDKERWQFVLFEPTEQHVSAIAVKNATHENLNIVSRKIAP